ncbi:GNAT superfamily N-acetyltransferase [Streptosporangium becharense]|uniref:GNAT superfamily N-acetyltransferase n=1 Tax=Streptosporangium becharense TaxID=1816182 RepID=A0A7W9IMW5_9ACTN|nr:GNAT family N-acetyltransferase [Streptosporangium becharense]MBB2914281.1 GNAT superfamily N-acetyltransferase [Streptosporangium becharense]MBB5823687.1 GNAT superfamily N-acetyltransferase [Streptosporangium becharense]
MHTIERLSAEEFPGSVDGLAEVLVDAVGDGASVGFLAPFDHEAAAAWWRAQAPAVADGSLIVWACRDGGGIDATVSLALAGKPNGRHRAEVVKLMVRRGARGRGLARALLATAEATAAAAGVTLLLLDTQTGSTAERVYLAGGWTRYGVVPDYAAAPDGSLQSCSFFYKPLTPVPALS